MPSWRRVQIARGGTKLGPQVELILREADIGHADGHSLTGQSPSWSYVLESCLVSGCGSPSAVFVSAALAFCCCCCCFVLLLLLFLVGMAMVNHEC